MVVLNRFDVAQSDLLVATLCKRIFYLSFTEDHKWGPNTNNSTFNVHSQHDRVALAEGCDLLQHAGEDSFLSLFGFALFSHFIDVLDEEVSQMIDDISSEYLYLVLFSVFLSISQDLNIEDEQTSVFLFTPFRNFGQN